MTKNFIFSLNYIPVLVILFSFTSFFFFSYMSLLLKFGFSRIYNLTNIHDSILYRNYIYASMVLFLNEFNLM